MPQGAKKEHKCSHHTENQNRWHNFHFSGKVIVFSVIFGLVLILVGGIMMAIGMDRDEDTKSDDYDDIQKKPPMVYVGPVIMGIGGFILVVGVFMFLVETKVCHRRTADASPLIEDAESGRQDSAATGYDSEPTEVPSTSHLIDKHRQGHRKKSPSPRRPKMSTKKLRDRNQKEATSLKSPSSAPINVGGSSPSKNLLNASDKFVTPPDSFAQGSIQLHTNSRDAENQTSSSLMESFTSSGMSWTKSTEFRTPESSFKDNSISLESSQQSSELQTSLSESITPIASTPEDARREFLTPKNSDADKIIPFQISVENQRKETSEVRMPINTPEYLRTVSNNKKETQSQVNILKDETTNAMEESNRVKSQSLRNSLDNSLDVSEKEVSESILSSESDTGNQLHIAVSESTSNENQNFGIQDTDANHLEGLLIQDLSNPEIKNELQDQSVGDTDLAYSGEDDVRTTIVAPEGDKCDVNDTVSKEPERLNTNSHEMEDSNGLCIEQNSEERIGDDSQSDYIATVTIPDLLLQKTMENESNEEDISNSPAEKDSPNKDETEIANEVKDIAIESDRCGNDFSSKSVNSSCIDDIIEGAQVEDNIQSPTQTIP